MTKTVYLVAMKDERKGESPKITTVGTYDTPQDARQAACYQIEDAAEEWGVRMEFIDYKNLSVNDWREGAIRAVSITPVKITF